MILPQRIKDAFKNGLQQNVLLTGSPGSGKTSLAKILSENSPRLFINVSDESSVETVREKITGFCSTISIMNEENATKVVVLDEFDGASDQFYKALRGTIEKFAKNTRFVATCNWINKVPDPIKSRFEIFLFDPVNKEEEAELKKVKFLAEQEAAQLKLSTEETITRTGVEMSEFNKYVDARVQGYTKLLNTISTHADGIQLLTDPVYIKKPLTIGSFENLHEENVDNGIKFKYHYSLSAWFYINPQPPSTSPGYTKYTTILNYGNKPKLQYNGLLNSLRVVSESGLGGRDDDIEIFETKNIIYQKWNNIVINYDGGTMDIFLNGELVGSSPNVVSYMRYENVEIGDLNGIQGGICNVVFHKSIMPKSKIVSSYRLLRNKKVPTTF